MTAERKEFIASIMNELDKKAVGTVAGENADARPGTQEQPTTTGGTDKRTERSAVGPLKTRACGAMAFQRRQRREKGRNLSSNFASIDRTRYFNTHIKNPTVGPPIGAYRNKYHAVDQKVRGPLYGTEKTWDNRAAEQAQKLKERSFSQHTKICSRLDRTLVLIRPHLYTRMVAESKANSSSMPPYSRGNDDSVNFAQENTSDGDRGRESVDHAKSHFGESAMTDFNRTQPSFPFREASPKQMGVPPPHQRKRANKHTFMPDPTHIATQNANRYLQPKKDLSRYTAAKIYDFQFDYERINNSHYCIARGPQFQALVKDEAPDFHEPYFHNSSICFEKSLDRAPFVQRGDGANERRFELDDTFDKSQYLSTV